MQCHHLHWWHHPYELTKEAEENWNTTTVPPVTMSQSTDVDPPDDGNPGGGGVGPSKGGSKEDAIDVNGIAAKAEDIMILEPERLTDVYKFTGVLELVELQKQGRAERKSILKSWRDIDKNEYAGIHLFQLSNWFKDFRFSAMVHPPPLDDNDGKEFWHFGFFVINPKASSLSLPSYVHYQERVHTHKCQLVNSIQMDLSLMRPRRIR
jgi:hypothetical protein